VEGSRDLKKYTEEGNTKEKKDQVSKKEIF
jgi:hypothetical protein